MLLLLRFYVECLVPRRTGKKVINNFEVDIERNFNLFLPVFIHFHFFLFSLQFEATTKGWSNQKQSIEETS